jgi:hypothetical protein
MGTPENARMSKRQPWAGWRESRKKGRSQEIGGLIKGGQAWPSQATKGAAGTDCRAAMDQFGAMAGMTAVMWQTEQAMQVGPSWQMPAPMGMPSWWA